MTGDFTPLEMFDALKFTHADQFDMIQPLEVFDPSRTPLDDWPPEVIWGGDLTEGGTGGYVVHTPLSASSFAAG